MVVATSVVAHIESGARVYCRPLRIVDAANQRLNQKFSGDPPA
jgi:hypothetical protein